MQGFVWIVLSVLSRLLCVVWCHARLMSPPSRSSMWRLGFPTETNFNDNSLYCGGIQVQWQKNGGKCGICGDPYDMPYPRDNEAGGKYGKGIISRRYQTGQLMEATVDVTTNHKGYFEFKLCPNNNSKKEVSQECLDKHTLKLEQGGTKYNISDKGNGDITVKLLLPKGMTCSQCVFQWTYVAGNNWGRCDDGESRLGCGPQETFRGCADIAIQKYHSTFTYKTDQNEIGSKGRSASFYKNIKQKLFKESFIAKYPTLATEITGQTLEHESTFFTESSNKQRKISSKKPPLSFWMTKDVNERSVRDTNKTKNIWGPTKLSTQLENRKGDSISTTLSSVDEEFVSKDQVAFSRSPSVLVIKKGTRLSNMFQHLEENIQLLRFYLQEDPASSTEGEVATIPSEVTAGSSRIVKDFWYL